MAKKIKHFIDIQQARLEDDEFRSKNTGAFHEGDIVQITRKIDGSNASISYDQEEKKLVCFSRNNELMWNKTLGGFYEYVQSLDASMFRDHPELYIFGEWNLCCNKIKDYKDEFKKKWIVYDIFDRNKNVWWMQEDVKDFCKKHDLMYIQELYYGPFADWNEALTYLENDGYYGDTAEGIVIKNQSAMKRALERNEGAEWLETPEDDKNPAYLKMVNASFKERKARNKKKQDNSAEREEKMTLVQTIVTQRRVEKALERLRDDGVIPEKIGPQQMSLIAKNLPKAVYDDCLKEEKEIVMQVGESFGKMCSSETMRIARKMIMG